MRFLRSLFTARPTPRCFALLDQNGRCRAFRECADLPAGSGWVEIEEIRLHWLNQFLPANARVLSRAERPRLSRALAA